MKRSIEEILDNNTGVLKAAQDVLDVMPTEEKDLLRRFITENRKDPSAPLLSHSLGPIDKA